MGQLDQPNDAWTGPLVTAVLELQSLKERNHRTNDGDALEPARGCLGRLLGYVVTAPSPVQRVIARGPGTAGAMARWGGRDCFGPGVVLLLGAIRDPRRRGRKVQFVSRKGDGCGNWRPQCSRTLAGG